MKKLIEPVSFLPKLTGELCQYPVDNHIACKVCAIRLNLPHGCTLRTEAPGEPGAARIDAPLLHASRMTSFLGEQQADLADAAAMIAMLDLVITIDTSIAHLAGAMGKPLWVLLPFSADWRWLRARTDNPWYPSARLFRQPAPGDWESVMRQVERSLRLHRFQAQAHSRDS